MKFMISTSPAEQTKIQDKAIRALLC
jgi:hypothetical protein